MDNHKEKIECVPFDELCTHISDDISQLGSSKYKLKSVFVLLHVIEACRNTLDHIDISNFLDSLKKKIKEVAEKTDLERNQLIQTFMQDEKVVEAIDSKESSIEKLTTDIKRKVEELDTLLGRIIRQRDQLTLPEIKGEEQ